VTDDAYAKPRYCRFRAGTVRLRHKLEADPARPRYLLTETGIGYRCVPDAAAADRHWDSRL